MGYVDMSEDGLCPVGWEVASYGEWEAVWNYFYDLTPADVNEKERSLQAIEKMTAALQAEMAGEISDIGQGWGGVYAPWGRYCWNLVGARRKQRPI